MSDGQTKQDNQTISGQRFDAPLYVFGGVTGEPERYLAEKPYELAKYEFSILKKGKFKSDTWFNLVCGATIGFFLLIGGKTLVALIQKETASLEKWELWSAVVGIVLAIALKIFRKKTPDEQEFEEARKCIEEHFQANPRRRVHVTPRGEEQQ